MKRKTELDRQPVGVQNLIRSMVPEGFVIDDKGMIATGDRIFDHTAGKFRSVDALNADHAAGKPYYIQDPVPSPHRGFYTAVCRRERKPAKRKCR